MAAANIVFALLFFYMQALYEYDGTCTETLFGLLVCGLSAISSNVYICMKTWRYTSIGSLIRDTRSSLSEKKRKRMKPQPHSDVSVPNSALEVFSVRVQLRLLTR